MQEGDGERSKPVRDAGFTVWFRLLGVLPLSFFLAQAVHYWRLGQLGHMLWMCNIGNLMMAIGLLFGQPMLIRVAALWSIPGVVIWFRYVVMQWGLFGSSMSAHVGGLIVGLVALRKVRVDRTAWLYCLGWFLILQLLSRVTTPVEMSKRRKSRESCSSTTMTAMARIQTTKSRPARRVGGGSAGLCSGIRGRCID